MNSDNYYGPHGGDFADARDNPAKCDTCGADCPQGMLTGGVCPMCTERLHDQMRDDEAEYYERMNLEERYNRESSDG